MGQRITTPTISLPTCFGTFQASYLKSGEGEAIVLQADGTVVTSPVLVRVQSSCVFSEAFHAEDCDCALQTAASLRLLHERGGIFVYCFEEARGAGLEVKFRAIHLQQQEGLNTKEAFARLGLPPDCRKFQVAAEALTAAVGKAEVELLTNNPLKVNVLRDLGVNVVKATELIIAPNDLVRRYLAEKRDVLGHLFPTAEESS